MNKEELQGIKEDVDKAKLEVGSREYPSISARYTEAEGYAGSSSEAWLGWVAGNVPLLIAALEACQQQLANTCEEREDIVCDLVADLRTLLAEAKAELIGRKESNKRYHKQMCDKEDERRITRKRLDETEAQLAAASRRQATTL